jgi:hypothetical protein
VRFFNVDHSIQFCLPNPRQVEAEPYAGSEFGRLQKALIWRDILQPGGHQIVEARNNSLAKTFRFEQKPVSNIIEFEVIGSEGLKFGDQGREWKITSRQKTVRSRQTNIWSGNRFSWIRTPLAWNHRGEVVEIELRFFRRDGKTWMAKVLPQAFVDATFVDGAGWLECDLSASYFSGGGDGFVNKGDATWSTARSATAGDTATYASSPFNVAGRLSTGTYYIQRAFLPFDSSGLSDLAVIDTATLYIMKLGGTTGSRQMAFIQTSQPDPTLLTTDDFDALTLNSPTEGASRVADTAFTTDVYQSISLNASGMSWISATGYTKLGVREGAKDIDDVTPSDSITLQFYSSEYTGTSKDPHLDLTYHEVLQITPTPVSSVAATVDPAVQLSSISTTPTAVTAVAQIVNPAVGIALDYTPSPVSVIGSKAEPSVQLGSIGVTPGVLSARASALDPTLHFSSAEITPGVVAATAAVVNPSVQLGSIGITPSAISAIAAVVNPTVSKMQWRTTWINKGPGFKVNDLVITQRKDFTSSGQSFLVYLVKGKVIAVGIDPATSKEYADIYVTEGYQYIENWAEEFEWIVIGNTTDPTRSNIIYLTADEDFSPRIELRSGVTSHELFGSMESLRAALGNLAGITDANFGALSGYGLYTENVYLKGKIAGGSASALMTGAGYWFEKEGSGRLGNPATNKYIKFDVATGIIELGSAVALQWSAVTGAGKPQDYATVGADWGANVTGRPTNLVALGDVPGYITSTYIGSTEIKAPNITGNSILGGNIVASSGGTNTAGLTGEGSGDSAVRIWAGSTYANRANSPFRVTQEGVLKATNAEITGAIISSTFTTGSSGDYIEIGTVGAGGGKYSKFHAAAGQYLTVDPQNIIFYDGAVATALGSNGYDLIHDGDKIWDEGNLTVGSVADATNPTKKRSITVGSTTFDVATYN